MTIEQTMARVEAFFRQWEGASLKLPSGWFGRPYDNVHELTSISAVGETLVIELDHQLVLSIEQSEMVVEERGCLRLGGYRRARWNRREYGAADEHSETFESGVIEFVAITSAIE